MVSIRPTICRECSSICIARSSSVSSAARRLRTFSRARDCMSVGPGSFFFFVFTGSLGGGLFDGVFLVSYGKTAFKSLRVGVSIGVARGGSERVCWFGLGRVVRVFEF